MRRVRVVPVLLALNGAVFLAWKLGDYQWMLRNFSVASNRRQLLHWTLLTSTVSHIDIGHLFNNMMALQAFGQPLQRRIGDGKVLTVYFLGGLLANAYWAWRRRTNARRDDDLVERCVGASGSISCLAGMFAWLYPQAEVVVGSSLVAPASVYAIAYLCGEFIQSQRRDPEDSVAHSVHWMGSIIGICFAILYRAWQGQPLDIRRATDILRVNINMMLELLQYFAY